MTWKEVSSWGSFKGVRGPQPPFISLVPSALPNAVLHFLVPVLSLTLITDFIQYLYATVRYFVLMTSAYSQYLKNS